MAVADVASRPGRYGRFLVAVLAVEAL